MCKGGPSSPSVDDHGRPTPAPASILEFYVCVYIYIYIYIHIITANTNRLARPRFHSRRGVRTVDDNTVSFQILKFVFAA